MMRPSNWDFTVHRWHSINLIPSFDVFNIADEDYTAAGFKIVARCLQLILFGFIISIMWPSKREKRQFGFRTRGPLYSRRNKRWYRPREIGAAR
jgi:hypothetical protein